MSAEAPGEVREGFYDLPEVPGVPGLATDAMKAIMASVSDGARWARRGKTLLSGCEGTFRRAQGGF